MKRVLLAGLLFGLAACGRSTPHDKLVEAIKTIHSWTATARMVGEAWQQGSVPDPYAQQTLTKSQHEIDQAIQQLSSPPALFQQVQQAIQAETQNVEQGNKAAIATSLKTISAQQQQLKAMAEAEGAQL
ncbi:MAG TPA: hypothetical protein V6C65_29670 [Allocoleopsis sp.]